MCNSKPSESRLVALVSLLLSEAYGHLERIPGLLQLLIAQGRCRAPDRRTTSLAALAESLVIPTGLL